LVEQQEHQPLLVWLVVQVEQGRVEQWQVLLEAQLEVLQQVQPQAQEAVWAQVLVSPQEVVVEEEGAVAEEGAEEAEAVV
jgi:hypothetical protein